MISLYIHIQICQEKLISDNYHSTSRSLACLVHGSLASFTSRHKLLKPHLSLRCIHARRSHARDGLPEVRLLNIWHAVEKRHIQLFIQVVFLPQHKPVHAENKDAGGEDVLLIGV